MSADNLQEILLEDIKDLYDAEHQILSALPKMADKCTDRDLKEAFNNHLHQTHQHVSRLEEVFAMFGQQPERKHCKGVAGLIQEGEEHAKEIVDADTLDAALIAAAQKVEHYEMAGYGTARTWAKRCGFDDAASTLQKTLDEEGETDHKLTRLAERGGINRQAAQAA